MKTTDPDLIVVRKEGCTTANLMHNVMDDHGRAKPGCLYTSRKLPASQSA